MFGIRSLVVEHESLRAKYDRLKAEYDESELDRKRLTYAYEELSEAFGILYSNYEKVKLDLMASYAYGALTTVALLTIGIMAVRRRLAARKRLRPAR